MRQNNDMILIGHLQVMDKPLSSLYSERETGKFFISVRLYEDNDDESYMFTEIAPISVLKYMDGQIGLKEIFCMVPSFYYRKNNHRYLSMKFFQPLSLEESCRKLINEGSLDDMFDKNLAYKSVSLKNYLRNYK